MIERIDVRALVLAVVSAAAMSGCVSSPGLGDNPRDPGVSREADSGATWAKVTWGDDATAWEQTFDGEFAATDADNPGGDVVGLVPGASNNERRYDISDYVTVGVPVYLEAELEAEMQDGDLDFDFELDDAVVWDIDSDAPFGGFTWTRWVVVRNGDGAAEAVVTYDEPEGADAVDFTLRLRVDPVVEAVPPGLALITPHVPAGAALGANALDDDPDTVIGVWDPEDRFLGYVDLTQGNWTHQVPDDGPPGEYVVAATSYGGPVSLRLQGEDGVPFAPRIPTLVREDGETIYGQDRIEWEFTVDSVPLAIGLRAQGRSVSEQFNVRLDSPEGRIVETKWPGPWLESASLVTGTWFADADVVAGTYRAAVDFGATAGPDAAEANVVSWTYGR